jgi:uncharacterized protein (DUF1800 family)
VTQAPVRPSAAHSTPEAPVTRRGLGRGLSAGLAAVAITPLLPMDAAEAVTRAHRRRCKHFHRCKRHPNHTCRHLHRCRHRHHQAPTPTKAPPAPPVEPPVDPPVAPPIDPTAEPGSASLLTAASLHLANRFTYGFTPGLHEQMTAAGSPESWFEAQLNPAAIADAKASAFQSWWPSIDLDAAAIWQRDQSKAERSWEAMQNYARWCLLRRIYSQRQVLEVMTEFWENHLHVPLDDSGVFTYRADYGKLLRRHALGRFDEMLVAAITHPAMGISLDNARSTRKSPNENLGRELLELHTVGRGNHTEDDVKNSARILTGYRVDMWTATWNAYYNPTSHRTGAVNVLGFSHANADPDGRAVTEAYLTYLAHHPKTAERIARKLAVRFVSDTPSEALVAHLAQVFLANNTEIKPVLRALVASGEFKAAAGAKVRTPTDDVVATHRALGTELAKVVNDDSAANVILWQTASIGQTPFAWGRPDGQPDDNRSWSSASRLLASFEVHYSMAGRWWRKEDVTYRTPEAWMPAPSLRFDELVNHLSTQLLGKRVPARLLRACMEATGLAADTTITSSHAVIRWQFAILLTTLLDSPDHMHR